MARCYGMFQAFLLQLAVSIIVFPLHCQCGEPTCDPGTDNTCGSSSDDAHLTKILSNIHTHEFFINGSWTKPHSTETLDLMDPSTGKAFAAIAVGDETDTDRAVQAAKAAFPKWSLHTTPAERKALVQKILNLYPAREEDMAHVISREMGSPIDFARSSQVGAGKYHIQSSLYLFDEFKFVRTLPNIHTTEESEIGTTILMDPVGVVGAITPWNWPLNQITIKVIPALLVGCTVVLKPSEITPLAALIFADMVREAGFPPGVFNLVNGQGPVVGQQLSSHPLVDMVSFTGSTRAGALVSKAAADTFKRVSLELGGKGATIVFDDVGKEWAEEIWESIDFGNSGQSCSYSSRFLIQQSMYDQAKEAIAEVAAETRVDSAHLEGDDHIGPVSNQVQYERIQKHIQLAIEQGATLLTGGLGKPEHLKDSPGAYVRPTIFADCTPEMDIFREEVFGPVICLTPFDTEEEAIELANATPYGLTNYVYSRIPSRRRRLAHALRSGQVEMNDESGDYGAPFGGMGASGIGREGGIYGMEEFCEIKSVTGYYDDPEWDVVLEEDGGTGETTE